MLTNERLKHMKGNIFALRQISESEQIQIINELLTFREATAPKMAEVDALQDPWVGQPFVEIIGTFRNMRYLTRTAILACEREKQRADEAATERDQWKKQCESECQYGYLRQDELDAMKAENESLTSQLSAIRDAGDEEVTLLAVGLSNDMSCGGIGVMNSILRLRDIAISRGQQLREARDEIEGLKRSYASLESQWLHEKENVEWQKQKVRNLRIAADAAGRTISDSNEYANERFTNDMEKMLKAWRECGVMCPKVVMAVTDIIAYAEQVTTSRDEVVGLLKWLHGLDITLDDGVHPVVGFADSRFADSAAYAEYHKNAKRILEIVEGK